MKEFRRLGHSGDEMRISDQIRIIRAQNQVDDIARIVTIVTRSLVALIMVGVGAYAIIAQLSIPDNAWQLGWLVLGALFGIDVAGKAISFLKNR